MAVSIRTITHTDLTGLKGLGSGFGLLLNCLIISLMLEVGSGFGLVGGGHGGGIKSSFFAERDESHS